MMRASGILLPLAWCLVAMNHVAVADDPFADVREIACEGEYDDHLQGIAVDPAGSIYWSFTTRLVKTDVAGKILAQTPVADHHGDLTFVDGRVVVAVNLGEFNQEPGKADSWLYVYDARDLKPLGKHAIPQAVHGAGGVAAVEGKFFVVGGLPASRQVNPVYEYDGDFHFVKERAVASGYTLLGVQTISARPDGGWWVGCYGLNLLGVDREFKSVASFRFDASYGVAALPNGRWLIGVSERKGKKRIGKARVAVADAKAGLRWENAAK